MADSNFTLPRVVKNPTFALSEFRELQNKRDFCAYHVAGCAKVALAELNLGEVESAQRILLSALSMLQDAEMAIDKFAKEHFNGNAAN